MRKLLFALLLLSVLAPSAWGQLTASKAFADAPASVVPLLSRNARLDMVDYYNSGSATPTKNAMQGLSRITALSPLSLSAVVTGSSDCQVALLPMRGDTAILLIETVLTPLPDSRATLYDRQWRPLATAQAPAPTLADWLVKGDDSSRAAAADMLPFVLASASYSPDDQVITFTQQMEGYFAADDYRRVAPGLRPSLAYRWDSRRFVAVK